MKNRPLKILALIFIVDIIMIFIISKLNIDALTQKILILCGAAIILVIFIITLTITFICIRENKIIDSLLDNEQYDQLLEKIKNLKTKKRLFLKERKYYYEYLEMLCYVRKDKHEIMEQYFANFTKYDYYPIANYWKACYEFSLGKYENIEKYYNYFQAIDYVRKKANTTFFNIINLFYSMVLFVNGNYNKAKENLKKVDENQIKMPCAVKSLEIIKFSKTNNGDEKSQ